jgi:putative NADPH-quinone reductase
MHALIVFDHPYGADAADDVPHRRSLSAALLAQARAGLETAGHTVDVIDLAADRFDPVLSAEDLRAWRQRSTVDPQVVEYQHRLAAADHLVFIFPTWWMAMPAATKGFLDRVLVRGFAFEEPRPGRALTRLLSRLERVTVLTPMTTPSGVYRWWFARPGQRILFRGTFGLIGIRRLRWFAYPEAARRGPAARGRMLSRTRRYFAALPA